MKLELFINDEDFIALDLIAKGKKDMDRCREIISFFRAGKLRMSIDESCSCLIIEYDGERCSFTISKEEQEAFGKGIVRTWHGEYRFIVSPCSEGCKFRFIKSKKTATNGVSDYYQKRLIGLYVPPPKKITNSKNNKKVYIQERLIEQLSVFSIQPLFEAVSASISQQMVLEV